MTTRDLGRLGDHVKAHRVQLYSSRLKAAQAVGISKDTWQRVEDGLTVQEVTWAKVERALGWAAGSCAVVAEGGEPVLVDRADGTAAAGARRQLSEEAVRRAAFEAARAKLPSAPIGDIDAFSDELVEVLRRSGDL
ncbi:hypothetical protein [Streptomyces sp. NPDC004721]